MGALNLTEQRRRQLAVGAAAVAVLMLIDVFYQVGMHVCWRRFLPETLGMEVATSQPAGSQPAGTQPAGNEKKDEKKEPKIEIDPIIKKRNVFTPPPSEGHGMELTGVIADTALFRRGGESIAIEKGKENNGVKVVEINGYEVVIEFKGKKETLKLFSDTGGPPSGGPERPEGGRRSRGRPGPPGPPAERGGPSPSAESRPAEGPPPPRIEIVGPDGASKSVGGPKITVRPSGDGGMVIIEQAE